MTLAPFARLEQRLNRTVQARLANAVATYNGGAAFGVLLDQAGGDPLGDGVVDVPAITVAFCVANASGIDRGHTLAVNGVDHIVSSPVQPDAGGWVTLTLYPKGTA